MCSGDAIFSHTVVPSLLVRQLYCIYIHLHSTPISIFAFHPLSPLHYYTSPLNPHQTPFSPLYYYTPLNPPPPLGSGGAIYSHIGVPSLLPRDGLISIHNSTFANNTAESKVKIVYQKIEGKLFLPKKIYFINK